MWQAYPFYRVEVQVLHQPVLEEGAQADAVVRDVRLLAYDGDVVLLVDVSLHELFTMCLSACNASSFLPLMSYMNATATMPSPTTTILFFGVPFVSFVPFEPFVPLACRAPLPLPVPFAPFLACVALTWPSASSTIIAALSYSGKMFGVEIVVFWRPLCNRGLGRECVIRRVNKVRFRRETVSNMRSKMPTGRSEAGDYKTLAPCSPGMESAVPFVRLGG